MRRGPTSVAAGARWQATGRPSPRRTTRGGAAPSRSGRVHRESCGPWRNRCASGSRWRLGRRRTGARSRPRRSRGVRGPTGLRHRRACIAARRRRAGRPASPRLSAMEASGRVMPSPCPMAPIVPLGEKTCVLTSRTLSTICGRFCAAMARDARAPSNSPRGIVWSVSPSANSRADCGTAGQIDHGRSDEARAAADARPGVTAKAPADRRGDIDRDEHTVRGVGGGRLKLDPFDLADRFAVEPDVGAGCDRASVVRGEIDPFGGSMHLADLAEDQDDTRARGDHAGDDETRDQSGPVDRPMQCAGSAGGETAATGEWGRGTTRGGPRILRASAKSFCRKPLLRRTKPTAQRKTYQQ